MPRTPHGASTGIPPATVPLPPDFGPPALRRKIGLWRPILLLILGLLVLITAAIVEIVRWNAAPWGSTLVNIDAAEAPEGSFKTRVRSLPLDQVPGVEEEILVLEAMSDLENDLVTALNIRRTEVIIAVEDYSDWGALLCAGRVPAPGTNEVLAGGLARVDSFMLDDETFNVVGTLCPEVGGLQFAFLLPYDPDDPGTVFSVANGAKEGWIYPAGLNEMSDVLSIIAGDNDLDDDDVFEKAAGELQRASMGGSDVHLAGALNSSFVKWSVLAALVIMATGGSWFHIRLFRRLARRSKWPTRALFRAMDETPRLWISLHVILFGVFALAMAWGLIQPLQNLRVMGMLAGMFSDGDLQYIGDAYKSGNVFKAAAATFVNNYWYQTLLFTLLVSFIPFAPGAFKTAASFGLVGFAMAPNPIGSASGYTYHSITMVLELEAYIVASFCAVFWVRQCWRALRHGDGQELKKGVSVMLGGALVTAVMLAIAGFYEATTLILLGGG